PSNLCTHKESDSFPSPMIHEFIFELLHYNFNAAMMSHTLSYMRGNRVQQRRSDRAPPSTDSLRNDQIHLQTKPTTSSEFSYRRETWKLQHCCFNLRTLHPLKVSLQTSLTVNFSEVSRGGGGEP
ncbi:hypothetical protein NQZ68_038981, partial [Dissostichus eleginoides]